MVQYKMLYALLCSSGVMPREKNLLTWEQSKAWHTLINCASQQQHSFVPNAAYDLQPSLHPSARPWPTVEHSPGAVAFSFLFYTLIYFSIRKISTLQMKRQQYIKIYTRMSEGKKSKLCVQLLRISGFYFCISQTEKLQGKRTIKHGVSNHLFYQNH